MGVEKKIITKGNGQDLPNRGDEVTIEYTGNLYDESKGAAADFRGKQCVTPTPSLHPGGKLSDTRLPLGLIPLKVVETSRRRLVRARS